MATSTANRVNGIDASYYYVQDLDRATKFYTELLGQEPAMSVPGMVTEWTFSGGETFGLYKPTSADGFSTGGGVMFAVDDVPAAVAAHSARGVKFSGDGHIEETPVCFMAFGEDTEGNGFILHRHK